MKVWWRTRRPELFGGLIYQFASLLGRSLRTQVEGYEAMAALPSGKVMLTWHGRSFVGGQYFRNRGYYVIISHSRDGEIQNRIFSRLGYKVIRGSSGRGGERALLESIRVLKAGATMALTPDGPRGPSGIVQGGVMAMARKSGAPLIPIGISARPRILAGSWDRHQIPFPFARASMVIGPPIYVPPSADAGQVEELRFRVEAEMHRVQAEAEARMGYDTARLATSADLATPKDSS